MTDLSAKENKRLQGINKGLAKHLHVTCMTKERPLSYIATKISG